MSQCDRERLRYEARRKAQLDYTSGMRDARRSGLAEGEAKGEAKGLMRMIRGFEQALRLPATPPETLAAMPLDELGRLADGLQQRSIARH